MVGVGLLLRVVSGCVLALVVAGAAGDEASPAAVEIGPFTVPSGDPEAPLRAAADEVRAEETGLQVTFREQEPGALSMSRFSGDRLHCEMRLAPGLEGALDTLAPMLYGRVTPEVQARFALAHELGHCRMRAAFMVRADGHVDDPSVFPWLAQEVAADVYGILLLERANEAPADLRRWIVAARRTSSGRQGDNAHATGNFLAPAMSIPRCRSPQTDPELLDCALGAAYMTVGYLAFTAEHAVGTRLPKPSALVELGTAKIDAAIRHFDSPADYEQRFVGADLSRFEFRDVAQIGASHYLTATVAGDASSSAAHRLADFYGWPVGNVRLGDGRIVEALRVERADDWEWLRVLGACIGADRATPQSSACRAPSAASAPAG